jgi:hypothetical protein
MLDQLNVLGRPGDSFWVSALSPRFLPLVLGANPHDEKVIAGGRFGDGSTLQLVIVRCSR